MNVVYPDMEKDILFHVPHEYRKQLGRPLSHDCLARVFTVRLSGKNKSMDIERLNTAIRAGFHGAVWKSTCVMYTHMPVRTVFPVGSVWKYLLWDNISPSV